MLTEYKRLKDMLREATPASEKYDKLLGELILVSQLLKEEPQETVETVKSVSFPEEAAPFIAPVEEKEDSLYSKEMVREILTEASKNGIKIQPIMQQFIPEGKPSKLSSVPTSSYAALVEAINNAR